MSDIYKVFRVKNPAELDSAPVALIADYPLEERDYKPYAQCNLCLEGQSLLLRMWAFELSPPQGSELMALLYLFEDKPDAALALTMFPDKDCRFALYRNGAFGDIEAPAGFRLHPHSGEDLQGVYWGGFAALPLGWLGAIGTLRPDSFPGNFYKLCDGPEMAHKGSVFPADFHGDPFSLSCMGKLLVV